MQFVKVMATEFCVAGDTFCLHNVYNACLCVYVSYQQVVLGGGQEAREVTTTTTKAGKFDARFYHLAFEEKIGRVKGHFGPIIHLYFIPMKRVWH